MRIVISAPDKVCTSCNTVRSVAFARDNRRISVANSVGDPLFLISVDAVGARGHRLHAGPVRGQAGRGGRGAEAGESQVEEKVAFLRLLSTTSARILALYSPSPSRMHQRPNQSTDPNPMSNDYYLPYDSGNRHSIQANTSFPVLSLLIAKCHYKKADRGLLLLTYCRASIPDKRTSIAINEISLFNPSCREKDFKYDGRP